MNKYIYYKVIQGNYGNGWDSEDWHETNSQGFFTTPEARKNFNENLRLYRHNGGGVYRVVHIRELR